jgi:hypothetical protein
MKELDSVWKWMEGFVLDGYKGGEQKRPPSLSVERGGNCLLDAFAVLAHTNPVKLAKTELCSFGNFNNRSFIPACSCGPLGRMPCTPDVAFDAFDAFDVSEHLLGTKNKPTSPSPIARSLILSFKKVPGV